MILNDFPHLLAWCDRPRTFHVSVWFPGRVRSGMVRVWECRWFADAQHWCDVPNMLPWRSILSRYTASILSQYVSYSSEMLRDGWNSENGICTGLGVAGEWRTSTWSIRHCSCHGMSTWRPTERAADGETRPTTAPRPSAPANPAHPKSLRSCKVYGLERLRLTEYNHSVWSGFDQAVMFFSISRIFCITAHTLQTHVY